jgi:hypothetical protein
MSERERKSPKLSDRPATIGRILIYTFTGEEHEDCGRAIHSERPAIVVREPLGSRETYTVQVFTACHHDIGGGAEGASGLMLREALIAAEPTPGFLHWPVVSPMRDLAREVSAGMGQRTAVPASADAPESGPVNPQAGPDVTPTAPKAKKSKRGAR